MVDDAYLDKEEWIKKSIRTTAKVGLYWLSSVDMSLTTLFRWESSAPTVQSLNTLRATGTLRVALS